MDLIPWSATKHWRRKKTQFWMIYQKNMMLMLMLMMLNYFSHIDEFQHVHMVMLNPIIPVANTKLGIQFEHLDMLKIQSVWNLSSTFLFCFILPQQRPVLVSAHNQNFFIQSWSTKSFQGNTKGRGTLCCFT